MAMALVACHKPEIPVPDEPDVPDEPVAEQHLFLSDDTLVFDGNETKMLYVWADRPCEWLIVDEKPGWIIINAGEPNFYEIYGSDVLSMTIESYMEGMPLEECSGTICFDSELGKAEIVVIGMPDEQLRYELPDTLRFPIHLDEASMQLKNIGNIPFHYEVSDVPGVAVSSSQGDCQVGETKDLVVRIDRNVFPYVCDPIELEITLNGVAEKVFLDIESKQYLVAKVIDAEYSKVTDELVYVASDATLNVYHPDTKETDVVPLFYMPTCVSVSPDGTKAVVGYDAHVSYVDLTTLQVLTTNDISYNAYDAVVTSNGWAYLVPRTGQWVNLRCIDVTTSGSQDCQGCQIRSATKIKLDVSENYVYGTDNGLSPSSIEKYDIRDFVAHAMYDAGGEPHGDLWLSENGDRIFTRGRTAYRTSEDQEQDLSIIGKIPVEGANYATRCYWIEHSERSKSLYLIVNKDYGDVNDHFVYVHDSDGFQQKDKIQMEKYMTTDASGSVTFFDAEPHFVFANTNGEEIYVLTKAVGSDLTNPWALQTFKMN